MKTKKPQELRFTKKFIDKVVFERKFKDYSFILEYIFRSIVDLGSFFAIAILIISFLTNQISLEIFLIGLVILTPIALVMAYLIFYKFNSIKLNHYELTLDKPLEKPFKFIFISDIHAGPEYEGTKPKKFEKIVDLINNENVDLVILGGDLIDKKLDLQYFFKLSNIKAKYKIAVYGNHDNYYRKDWHNAEVEPKEFIRNVESLGFKVLQNDGILYENGNDKIFFAGIPDLYSKNFDLNVAFEKAPENSRKILISHNPDIVDFVDKKDNIDWILAGHNHGGMINLPFIGPVLPLPSKYRKLAKGISTVVGKTKIFVSQGAGHSGTRVRVGTENEIGVVVLK